MNARIGFRFQCADSQLSICPDMVQGVASVLAYTYVPTYIYVYNTMATTAEKILLGRGPKPIALPECKGM